MFTRVLEVHKNVLHVICWLLNICLIYVKFLQKKFVKYLERIEKVPTFALAKRKTAVPQWRSSFERDAPKEILKKNLQKDLHGSKFRLNFALATRKNEVRKTKESTLK